MRSYHPVVSVAVWVVFASTLLLGCGPEEDPSSKQPRDEEVVCDVDCAGLEAPPCMKSVCNDGSLPGQAGRCTTVPLEDGMACDDGDPCTVGAACVEGSCRSGEPLDCSDFDGACVKGQCNPGDGSCMAVPASDGDACETDDLCLTGTTCSDGVCGGGKQKDCSELDGLCIVGRCDASDGECKATAVDDGTSCDDGDACTVGDACVDGACVGGDPMDCSGLDGTCLAGICDPATGHCLAIPTNEGGPCESDDRCQVENVCVEGVCQGGSPKDCTPDEACKVGQCNPSDGSCIFLPSADGGSCEDGDPCTVGDRCLAGACVTGLDKDCSSLDSPCSVGVCDQEAGGCKAEPINEGLECPIDLCHSGGTCIEGVCTGGDTKDCSAFDDTCTEGVCNPSSGLCEALPANEEGACDDGDLCTIDDRCNDGFCEGDPACAHLETDCMAGYCDPEDGTCHGVPVDDGTPCNDGNLCKLGATCSAGLCVGGTFRDCSNLDSECAVGTCNPSTGTCEGAPTNEGVPCDDGLLCTVNSICVAGACTGGIPPACSLVPDGCCPAACDGSNDADCGCPGEFIDGFCVYMPTTVSSPNKSAARAECAALGPSWELCIGALLCTPDTLTYIGVAGCSCFGGTSACNCEGSGTVYVQVENGDSTMANWINHQLVPGCNALGTVCDVSTAEACGAPLCCKPTP